MECQLEKISLHYTSYGDGHPMILLHGFGLDHRLMTGCLEPLLQPHGGQKRMYLDLPGMGKTPGKEWLTSSDQMLDVVIDFIDTIIPGQRFVLAGESYGGYLARGVTYRKPALVHGLLLICPMIVANPTQRIVPSQVALVRDAACLASLEAKQRQDFESFAVVQTPRTWERPRDESR
jgi:pimeloyl-ACP methyl ester carboxylesterase